MTPSFEIFCYTVIVLLILWIRHEQTAQPPQSPVYSLPVSAPCLPPAHTAYTSQVTREAPRNAIAAKALAGMYTTKISYSAWGEFEPGWNVGANGKPLSGAALNSRRQKLERERSHR